MPTYPFESRLWNPCVSSSKPSTPIPRAGTAVPEVRPGFGARRAGIARPYRAFSVPEPVLPNTRSRLVFEPSRRCSARHHPGTRKTSGSHPLELNSVTIGVQGFPSASDAAFRRRCDLAYGPPPQTGSASDIEWPIAIIPTHVHPRMRSQKGLFHSSRRGRVEFRGHRETRRARDRGAVSRVPHSGEGGPEDPPRAPRVGHHALHPVSRSRRPGDRADPCIQRTGESAGMRHRVRPGGRQKQSGRIGSERRVSGDSRPVDRIPRPARLWVNQ